MKPLYFKQSWVTTFGHFAAACVALAACVSMGTVGIVIGDAWKWFWLATSGASGLAGITYAGLVVRPFRLSVTASGFSLSGGWSGSPRDVAWTDLDGPMGVFSIQRGQETVGFNYVADVRQRKGLAQNRHKRFFPDAWLPDVWTLSADELAKILNSYRDRAIREAE